MTMVEQEVMCPKCGGKTWDNRLTKKNPKAPDYKCRDRSCDGCVWPPKNGAAPAPRAAAPTRAPLALGAPMPWEEQEETGAPPVADKMAAKFALYSRCLDQARLEVVRTGLDKMGGDVAGAVAAMAATLFIQASK